MIEINQTMRFILIVLTCYRLARMIADDDGPFFIFKRIRYWIKDKGWEEAFDNGWVNEKNEVSDRWMGEWYNLSEGVSCSYCVAVWLSAPLFFMLIFPTYLGDLFLILISISGAQALLRSLGK